MRHVDSLLDTDVSNFKVSTRTGQLQPDSAHALVLEGLRHLFVGGMPAAVSVSAGDLSLQAASARQDAVTRSRRIIMNAY